MTMQVRDVLAYEGRPRAIRALPLTGCDRPVPAFGGRSSACWRGYVGGWEFRDDALHLAQLEPPFGDGGGRGWLAEMFPEASGPVEAVWFSGEIVPDDVTDPNDHALVRLMTDNHRPVHFTAFVAVVRRGKLLLETVTNPKAGAARSRLTPHAEELFPGEEFAFLSAIQAGPDDLTVKLVYADWLDERGDPRGPLLRAEAIRPEREGPVPPRAGRWARQSVPTGCVPAENVVWFWRHLAGIPEPTPEELRYQEICRRVGAES